MNEQEFQSKLAELMGEISTLPVTERQKLEKLAGETRQRHERLRQTVSNLQESLDYLRLSIKYLVFDSPDSDGRRDKSSTQRVKARGVADGAVAGLSGRRHEPDRPASELLVPTSGSLVVRCGKQERARS